MIQEKEIARPADGTAERAAMETTACRASIPTFKSSTERSHRQDHTNIFRETRERVSAQDAARHYGLTFDRRGWALCPFHADKHPSMSFHKGRFRCWVFDPAGATF